MAFPINLSIYWVLVAVMAIGILGAFVPALPGISLVAIAIFVWGLVAGFQEVAVALGVAIVLLLVSVGIDFLAGYLGAKQAGASKWGQLGSIFGLVLGMVGLLPALPFGGPVLGILVGAFLGAVIGEYLHCKDLPRSTKAGVGLLVGSILGNVIQGLLAIATVVVFLVTTWPFLNPAIAPLN
jgi:uncharacterized protein